jgi:peptidoglycan/LPS O-acetylase OafA/YrhL
MKAETYRPEVDGLRAVAVLAVVLYHADLGIAPGGFAGVDVFFVISGYLITSIILAEVRAGRFSFAAFYKRRIRRIIPALYLVMASSVPFAWISMTPTALKDFGQAIVATTSFVSNVLFYYKGSGYFATDPQLNPLLHTWSLAVEEQFYILFPLILLLVWRLPAIVSLALLALAIGGGVVAADALTSFDRTLSFFLLPSRVWELSVGVACAVGIGRLAWAHGARGAAKLLTEGLALVGLVLILASTILIDHDTRWPSYATAAPVLGTALVIMFAAPRTACHRLLALPPVVGIGLVSYSFYLWHQPVFAFYRLRSFTGVGLHEKVALIGLSFALAYLSWRFVERPFRTREPGQRIQLLPLIGIFAGASASLLAVGAVGHVFHGFPERFSPDFRKIAYAGEDRSPLLNTCALAADAIVPALPIAGCLRGPSEQSSTRHIDVAVIGDSHAATVANELQELLSQEGLTSYAAPYYGCPPITGVYRVADPVTHRCPEFMDAVWRLIETHGVRTVVLHARWTIYWQGDYFDNGEGGVETDRGPAYMDLASRRGGAGAARHSPERQHRMLAQYKQGIQEFLARGLKVVLVYPVPEPGWNMPMQAARYAAVNPGQDLMVTTQYERFLERNAETIALFDAIDDPNLVKVRPDRILCDTFVPRRCILTRGRNVLYFDYDHLSPKGGRMLAPQIANAILQRLPPAPEQVSATAADSDRGDMRTSPPANCDPGPKGRRC